MSWSALAAVLMWGASFVVAKVVLAEISPLQLVFVRAVLATVVLDLYLWRRGGWSEAARLTRREWVRIGLLALVSVLPHQLVQMVGLRQTTAINGALLITLAPLFMFGIGALFLGERVSWLKIVGFVTAILGSALVITHGELRTVSLGSGTLVGDLLIVVSALGWALYSTLSKDLLREHSPLLIVALVFSLSVPVLALTAAFGATNPLSALRSLTWRGWAGMLFLAWGCSALGYVLWYSALRRQEVSRVGILQYVQPLVAAVLGILLLGESPVWATAGGGAMILGGVALANRRRQR
jgi:drug/metabolite transporter (DMT)-like permease